MMHPTNPDGFAFRDTQFVVGLLVFSEYLQYVYENVIGVHHGNGLRISSNDLTEVLLRNFTPCLAYGTHVELSDQSNRDFCAVRLGPFDQELSEITAIVIHFGSVPEDFLENKLNI
jgi:hypothetical protein